MNRNQIILCAHRGDRKKYPENTIPAFRSAVEFGVDMLEFDFHMTKDGELIILHDLNAKRTTGVDRLTCDMTLEEIRQLDAGYLFGEEYRGIGVPTVREVFELVKNTGTMLNLEQKDYPAEVGSEWAFACADKMVAMIEEYGMADRIIFNSFSNQVLEYVYTKYNDKYPLHGQGALNQRINVDECSIPDHELYDFTALDICTAEHSFEYFKPDFDYCRKHGIVSSICTKDSEEVYRVALAYGVTEFVSNDIYEADRILRKLGKR